MSAGSAVGRDAWPLLVQFHLPIVVEQRGDHRGPDIVGRVEAALVHLLAVHPGVVHDQQHAAGRDGCEQRPLRRRIRGPQQRRVQCADQVERRRPKRRLDQSGMHPADGDTRVSRVLGRPLQRHARDLEAALKTGAVLSREIAAQAVDRNATVTFTAGPVIEYVEWDADTRTAAGL